MSSPKVRVVIENITPRVDCGRFPIKRTSGESVVVEADVFTDGHDQVAAVMMYRHDSSSEWHRIPMKAIGNDRWRGEFTVQQLGSYQYSVCAWMDHLESWRRGIRKKYEARQDIQVDLKTGARLAEEMAERAHGTDAQRLREWAVAIIDTRRDLEARAAPGSPEVDEDDLVLGNSALEVLGTKLNRGHDLSSRVTEYPRGCFAFILHTP